MRVRELVVGDGGTEGRGEMLEGDVEEGCWRRIEMKEEGWVEGSMPERDGVIVLFELIV